MSIECAINEYVHVSTDPATIHAALLSYVAAAKALGFANVVVVTMADTALVPFSARSAINALDIADAAGNGYTIADVSSDATMGCNGCGANLTYFQDGTHPTVAGNAILATYLKSALQTIGFQ